MAIIPERTSQTSLLAFMHKQMWQKPPYTQQWYGLMSLEITLTNIKRNNHHGVNTKRSSLLHYDSKLWSINFVLNNIKIKSTTVLESYKMVHTCTFNYVTMSIPNPKRNRCARPQLRTLIEIHIKGYHHRWILPLFGLQQDRRWCLCLPMIIVNSMYDLSLFTLLVADPFGQLFPWIHRGE